MQILEQVGEFKNTEHVLVECSPELCAEGIFLRGVECALDFRVCCTQTFTSNEARDGYLNTVVKWISEEQFASGKLEIGDLCKFSNDGKKWTYDKYAGMCAKQLGEPRFLCAASEHLIRFKYAYPAVGSNLQIDGDFYTWELMGDE